MASSGIRIGRSLRALLFDKIVIRNYGKILIESWTLMRRNPISITFMRDFLSAITSSNKTLLIIVSVLIAILIIDTVINNVVDFISNEIVSSWSIILFGFIAAVSAIGQYFILDFVKQKSKEIRTKSVYLKIMHTVVTIVQSFLTAIIVFVILEIVFTSHYHGVTLMIVTDTSYILNVALLVILAHRFLLWYTSNRNSIVVLLYGLSAVVLAISSMLTIPYDSYELLGKQGEITPYSAVVYPSFEPGTITTMFHEIYNYSILISFILVWLSTALLLQHYSQKVGKIKHWILVSLPLIYYLSSLVQFFNLYVPSSDSEQFYYYLYTSLDTTAGGFLIGLAFRSIGRSVWYNNSIRDYMVISAYGFVLLFISNQTTLTAASYPPYGIVTVSFMGLSSYLIFVGIYSAAISVAQDVKLRESIKKSTLEESKLLVNIGSAQMEQKIQSKVVQIAKEQAYKMTQNTGVQVSLTESDIKQYLSTVLKEIKVLQNINEILDKEKEILDRSTEFICCLRFSGMRLIFNNYFELYDKVTVRHRNGEHKGIRWVTSIIDKNNADLARRFLNIGVQIRHVKNMPPIDFAVSDKEIIATIQKMQSSNDGDDFGIGSNNNDSIQNLLVSNEVPYIRHFTSIFEELWKTGIDASDRIKDIEEGVEKEVIEIIQNPLEIRKVGFDLIKSAVSEIVIIFATANAFHQEERAGTLQLLKEAEKRNVKIRILMPADDLVRKTIEDLKMQEQQQQLSQPMELRYIEPDVQTKVTILVVDKKFLLAIELKDDNDDAKQIYRESMGLATYSNSKSTVLSYASIFDTLWKQSELYEILKIHSKLQKDFVDIAAHELRTPITPILITASNIKADSEKRNDNGDEDGEDNDDIRIKKDDFEIIFRSAKRLKQLTDIFLDVAKIESGILKIEPERFNLNDEILKIIQDYSRNVNADEDKSKRPVKLYYQQPLDGSIFIVADKGRINQVVLNLLDNAIKFTKEGSITVTSEKKDGHVIVGVKDTGTGIDPEVLPRLFTKFATKSGKGTGLGLFISKSIVEAHGGRIWVDNSYTDGTAIQFSLPC